MIEHSRITCLIKKCWSIIYLYKEKGSEDVHPFLIILSFSRCLKIFWWHHFEHFYMAERYSVRTFGSMRHKANTQRAFSLETFRKVQSLYKIWGFFQSRTVLVSKFPQSFLELECNVISYNQVVKIEINSKNIEKIAKNVKFCPIL